MNREKVLVIGSEPEARFPVPLKEEFGDSDWIHADKIAPIGGALIAALPELASLSEMTIVYLWKRKGAEKPRRLLGKCQRPTGLLEYFSGAHFIVWLAANNCHGMTAWQIEALVFHELKHAGFNADGEPALIPHDWEGFHAEIDRYGIWKRDIQPIAESCARALTLPFDDILARGDASSEILGAAARLAPSPGSGVTSVEIQTGEGETLLRLDQADGERLRKAARTAREREH